MPKRRANGEGNIRKRKDGRWEGRYTVGHDPETGKAIHSGSQSEAGHRSLLMLFLVILRLVDIFPTIW